MKDGVDALLEIERISTWLMDPVRHPLISSLLPLVCPLFNFTTSLHLLYFSTPLICISHDISRPHHTPTQVACSTTWVVLLKIRTENPNYGAQVPAAVA